MLSCVIMCACAYQKHLSICNAEGGIYIALVLIILVQCKPLTDDDNTWSIVEVTLPT